jgi:hypothetical protein
VVWPPSLTTRVYAVVRAAEKPAIVIRKRKADGDDQLEGVAEYSRVCISSVLRLTLVRDGAGNDAQAQDEEYGGDEVRPSRTRHNASRAHTPTHPLNRLPALARSPTPCGRLPSRSHITRRHR